jgi:hypothetical protein
MSLLLICVLLKEVVSYSSNSPGQESLSTDGEGGNASVVAAVAQCDGTRDDGEDDSSHYCIHGAAVVTWWHSVSCDQRILVNCGSAGAVVTDERVHRVGDWM